MPVTVLHLAGQECPIHLHSHGVVLGISAAVIQCHVWMFVTEPAWKLV